MTKIRSFALGGLDEIGKSLFVVEVNQDIFVFDCGLKILKEVDFGVNSLIPDFNYLIKNKNRIKGVFISKIDIVNAYSLSFLLKKIPDLKIFVSKISQQLLKFSSLLTERQIKDSIYQIDNQPIRFGDNLVHCFYTASNLPGSCGFSLDTLDGYIVYTGSFILETGGSEEVFTTQINKILFNKDKKVLLLITNANQLAINDFIAPNNQVDKWLNDVLFDFKNKLFICCEENEWYKMFQIITKIEKLNLDHFQFSFFDDNFGKKFKKIAYEYLKSSHLRRVLEESDATSLKNKKNIIFLTGNQKWLFSRILSLINNKNDKTRLTKEDHIWILGESPFVGELAIVKILNELYKTDATIEFTGKSKILSMEAGLEDVKLLINFLKPQYLFPTNGYHKDLENAHKFVELTYLNREQIFIKKNGEIVTFENKKYIDSYEAIPTESVFVDNFLNTNITESVINERKILSEEGILFTTFCYFKNNDSYFMNSKIKNIHFGITKEQEQIDKINNAINNFLNKLFKEKAESLNNSSNLTYFLKRQILSIVKKTVGKRPLVFVFANFS